MNRLRADGDPFLIIFVHPETFMTDRTILPLSIPALIKRIPYPVRGMYGFELRDEDIRKASIALLDIHWYTSLFDASRLARRIKIVNPKTIVIAGGLTASLFSRQIVTDLDFDFVIRGDAEKPLPELISKLLDGGRLDDVPNLAGKNGLDTPWTYRLTEKDINENDYLYMDFFPSALKEIRKLHSINPGWPYPTFPWLVPFRGCSYPCKACVGSTLEQRKYFRRTAVRRSPESIAGDLEKMGLDTHLKYVVMILDFLTQWPAEDVDKALKEKSRLYVSVDFADLPSAEILDLVLSRFRGGLIRFTMDHFHATSADLVEVDRLIERIKSVSNHKGFVPLVQYNSIFSDQSAGYRRSVERVLGSSRVGLYDAAFWWTDFPQSDFEGNAAPSSFDLYTRLPRKYRFFIMNRKIKLGLFLDRVLPGFLSFRLRFFAFTFLQSFFLKIRNFLRVRNKPDRANPG